MTKLSEKLEGNLNTEQIWLAKLEASPEKKKSKKIYRAIIHGYLPKNSVQTVIVEICEIHTAVCLNSSVEIFDRATRLFT